MSERRPDRDAFREAVLARIDEVDPGSTTNRIDRDARRTLAAMACVVMLLGAWALATRWVAPSDGVASPATASSTLEGAFERLSIDPVDRGSDAGNHSESATEPPGERYEAVVAAAPGRST